MYSEHAATGSPTCLEYRADKASAVGWVDKPGVLGMMTGKAGFINPAYNRSNDSSQRNSRPFHTAYKAGNNTNTISNVANKSEKIDGNGRMRETPFRGK